MNDIYLLTGGNMGNRLHHLQSAFALIEKNAGRVVTRSSIYETAPWGNSLQEPFLNQVLSISSTLDPYDLLLQLLSIELELGRKRREKMGPRVIDIDILLYADQIISQADLIVPHPRMAERRFVLIPLNEIAPNFMHPVLHKTINELLKACPDRLEVIKCQQGI
ncbi:MAG: 2-amino-4-hydroxy-6-hydroxymethyldihydropteridine diphosphokinase [Bacteroidota bacterium]|nr:2-amino-4-hydroxy-6-hydroxymethyldihydropteridine diphosphokinase [Bacteroidota bacterium]